MPPPPPKAVTTDGSIVCRYEENFLVLRQRLPSSTTAVHQSIPKVMTRRDTGTAMLHLFPTGSNVTVTIKTIRRHPVCGSKVPSLTGSGEAPSTLLFFASHSSAVLPQWETSHSPGLRLESNLGYRYAVDCLFPKTLLTVGQSSQRKMSLVRLLTLFLLG